MSILTRSRSVVCAAAALLAGCASVDDLKSIEDRMALLETQTEEMHASFTELDRLVQNLSGAQHQLADTIKGTQDSLSQDIRALMDGKASAADLASSREGLSRQITELEGRKANRTDVERLEREKFAVRDIERLGLDDIRRRLTAIEYDLRMQREELLTGASTGYRNAVRAARECVVEMEPAISKIFEEKGAACSVFIRDFRTLDDTTTVLGDLLSREFTAFMNARSGLQRSLYREEYVIGLYQQKKLQVPAKEAFNLEYLEKGGFPASSVLVISGRITPTAQAYRLDVEAVDLHDPQFRVSAYRLIPKDADLNQMHEQILRVL